MVISGWKKYVLRNVGTFKKGAGISRDESNSGNIPAVRYGEIYTTHDNYVKQYISHISEEVAAKSLLIQYGDLLFACSGETKEDIAKCVAIIDRGRVYAGGDIIVLTPEIECNPIFWGYALNANNVVKQFSQKAQGDAIVHISTESIKSVEVIAPDYPEQCKIAQVLSDIDEMIASLEKLIVKKKSIKQGTMQDLLTGGKRLPGFSGKWNNGKWKDVLSCFSSGATPYRGNADNFKGNIKWVSSGELNYNFIYETIEHISTDAQQKTNLTLHPAGTFLMAITGLEAAGTRGSCAILGTAATTNQSCMAIYGTSKMSTEYLFHYYVCYGNELAFQYCQGTKQQSYTAAIVKELPIFYPEDIKEQQAIASVLSDMDSEIEALEQKLSKCHEAKQGMMQQLLTGKIRLV